MMFRRTAGVPGFLKISTGDNGKRFPAIGRLLRPRSTSERTDVPLPIAA
jgi:hypothetical protein